MKENEIVKPITVIREEIINEIVSVLDKSKIPFFMLEDILKLILSEVSKAAVQQLESDKKRYNTELEKSKQKEESK